MDHQSGCLADDCVTAHHGVRQTLDEMDFERGIWMAAKDNDMERVRMLLNKGVSPNQEDSAGYRPLHYAARNGHYHMCELLLDNGAEVNAITGSVRATALHRAATQGHGEVVNVLLNHGADVNRKDVDGRTALHRALSVPAPSREVFQLLIATTDLEIRDGAGRTVEDLAAENCETALMLIHQRKESSRRETETTIAS